MPSAASLNHTPRPARMLPEEVSAKAFKRRSSSRRPIAHGITALRPLARPTLPRPPHSEPNVRDDRDTPLWRAGTGGVVGLIWGRREQVFLLRGLDSNQVICPSCQFAAGSSRWIYWTGESVKHASDLLVAQTGFIKRSRLSRRYFRFGQNRKCVGWRGTSVLPHRADLARPLAQVSFGPRGPDIRQRRSQPVML